MAIKLTTWKDATLYHMRQQLTIDQIQALPKWSMPTKTQESTLGLYPIYGEELAVPIDNSGVWFRLRSSVKKPETTHFNVLVSQRIETLKGKGKGKIEAVKMNKTEHQGIQEDVRGEMMKTTHPKHKDIDVMFHGDWFMVTSASANDCDMVTKFLRDNLEDTFSVAVATMKGDDPLTKIGLDVLGTEQLIVGNIELGDQIKIKGDTGNVAVSNADYDGGLLDVLSDANEVQSMTVTWATEYTAKVNSDFSFSGVKFDVDTDAIEGEDDSETAHLRDQERATKLIQGMPKFLKDLAVHCDGLAELPDQSEQGVIDFAARKQQRKDAATEVEA